MKYEFQTLTPIWTGGIDSKNMDRIDETNIVGHLRWWYEAIVRGLGGYACDINSENPCSGEKDTICDACRLFGNTGKRRLFRLNISGGNKLFIGPPRSILIPSGRIHPYKRSGRTEYRLGGWYLHGESFTGEISMKILPLSKEFEPNQFNLLVYLISNYGSIGGKISSGYGALKIREIEEGTINLENSNFHISHQKNRNCNYELPSIDDMFFAKYQFASPLDCQNWWINIEGFNYIDRNIVKDYVSDRPISRFVFKRGEKDQGKKIFRSIIEGGICPISPPLRDMLRRELEKNSNFQLANYLFGSTRNLCPTCYSSKIRSNNQQNNEFICAQCRSRIEKSKLINPLASKINISYAYKTDNNLWEFRVWGWIPRSFPLSLTYKKKKFDREIFLKDLRRVLIDKQKSEALFGQKNIVIKEIDWHSCDSEIPDGHNYLKELLQSTNNEGVI